MAPEILDVDEIIKRWAREFPLERDQKKLVADDILTQDINIKHFRVTHDPPKYEDESRVGDSKSHVLFTAVFSNSTDEQQTYNFSTQRKTRSTCTVVCTKGYRFEAHMDIKLLPPNPVLQANGGFKSEMMLSKSSGQTFEEELLWSVDSQVKVPPQYRTKAALVIKEDEYKGSFSVKSKFEGKVHVTLRNKRDNSALTTITGTVKQIFTPQLGFQVDKSGIYCVTEGNCKCRYGIQQRVKLTQKALQGDDASDED